MKHAEISSESPSCWAITGVAGFIGSNLLEALLAQGQEVVGLDNLSAGPISNLEDVKSRVTPEQWARFRFQKLDIRERDALKSWIKGARFVLHQAAMGSVPRSIKEPTAFHDSNVTGTLNVLEAAREMGVDSVVYASSSSVYGDSARLPKRESETGNALSPYAVTKRANELYAGVYASCYGMAITGLRYFNVFGRRQNPNGPYAAVIPQWISALIRNEPVYINGDGETSRDFCFVQNVVQANLLAAVNGKRAESPVYNVAFGARTTLNELFESLKQLVADRTGDPGILGRKPVYRDFRAGDIRHSLASIENARREIGYVPQFDVAAGLAGTVDWYLQNTQRG